MEAIFAEKPICTYCTYERDLVLFALLSAER
jgi:hypothetical protein